MITEIVEEMCSSNMIPNYARNLLRIKIDNI